MKPLVKNDLLMRWIIKMLEDWESEIIANAYKLKGMKEE